MNQLNTISKREKEYKHYHDYVFKEILQKRANGVLKFLGIPYEINNIILSEIASKGPSLHRLDFVGEVRNENEEFCIILECQSRLPTDEDIMRFFQYVSSLHQLKNKKIKLYILCTKETPYKTREVELDDDCIYTMQVISLKHIHAEDIFKNIKNKIKYNLPITDEDIASLELIAYTNYNNTTLEILKKASKLVGQLNIDDNEKEAIFYILDVLSSNMLNNEDLNELMEETKMINPRYEYQINEGKKEGKKEGKEFVAKNLLKEGIPLEKIIKTTGLTKTEIQNL